MKKLASSVLLTMLSMSMFAFIFNIQPAKASGTIYIRADGSIDPPTASISTVDNVTYTFTDNINDSIVVERSDIIVDGAGCTLRGSGSGYGFYWSGIDNVTIRNTIIIGFDVGIGLYSSNNIISGNNITNSNWMGIDMPSYASNNTISGNNIANNFRGIEVESSNSVISGNNITNNAFGIAVPLPGTDNNIISGNNIANNGFLYGYDGCGIYIWSTDNQPHVSNSKALWNNFVGNKHQVSVALSGDASIWDDGYPIGGNYWSDYNGVDLYNGPYQNETGSDGIGDTPYNIDANNQDHYPLMSPSDEEYWYKDKTSPNGVPDFCQSDEGLNRRDCCMAVAFADSLWYFDHHGYPGLVDHTNPNNHEQNWQADSKKLINDLIYYIYDKDDTGKPGKSMGSWGVVEYIKKRNQYYDPKKPEKEGLYYKELTKADETTYTRYKKELTACEDVTMNLKAHVKDNGWLPDWRHSLAGAGLDPLDKKLIVSNPWGPSHIDEAKPVSESYYDTYSISITSDGKIQITDQDFLNRIQDNPNVVIDYAQVLDFDVISPKKKPSAKPKGSSSHLPEKNSYRYNYTIINDDYSAITEFAIDIRAPFQIDSIASPLGWEWQLWDPTKTPELISGPGHDEPYEWKPNWGGILWTTETNPIFLGENLSGFAYEAPDIYPPGESVTLCGLYDGADPSGGVCEVFSTSGPYEIADIAINAYCNSEATAVSVSITMDGTPTGCDTPHTFTGLTGTHTFTVPSTDTNGDLFLYWSTGSTSTTILVTSGGTYTAYYETRSCVPIGGVVIPVDKLGMLAPYIGLASTIVVGAATVTIYAMRRKKNQ